MSGPIARAAGVIIGIGVAVALLPVTWSAIAVAGVGGWAIWRFGGCPHPRPLSLLPPVNGPGDERVPARWFCGRCGQAWPAALDRLHPPIQRFHGYDATKAPQAARRAAALEQRLRELAIQRGGMRKAASPATASPTRTAPAAETRAAKVKQPVPIRRVAG